MKERKEQSRKTAKMNDGSKIEKEREKEKRKAERRKVIL